MKDKKSFLRGALCGALAVLIIFSLVSCGILTKTVVNRKTEKKLEKIEALIDKKYLREADSEKMTDALIAGYVEGLEDPYSAYFNVEETKTFNESNAGEYFGVGAVLTQALDTGIITATKIYNDSPAKKGGMRADDILYKVDDKEVTGKDLNEVVSWIRGEKGTKVQITVLRGEKQKELKLTMVRDKITVETVEHKMLEGKIGYVSVSEFDAVTATQFEDAIESLESEGMKGMIIDLRNNPGGSVGVVCQMADYMLPEGVVVYTEDKNGNRQEANSTAEHSFDKPLVVLVNGNSASASEIFTGAIQDHKIGTIVGTTTYGKGVIQQIFDLGDGTCVKLTISEYFTPNGRSIHEKGIDPDVEVEYEYDEAHPDRDNQLEKAIEVLKKDMK